MPDIQAQAKASLAGASTSFSSNEETRNLTEALALLSRYGDEFMDETPLVGEPGSFIFSKASDAPLSTRQVSRENVSVPGSSGTVPAKAE
jgi:mediator of RNA polymerase II transcription subunit 6